MLSMLAMIVLGGALSWLVLKLNALEIWIAVSAEPCGVGLSILECGSEGVSTYDVDLMDVNSRMPVYNDT